MFRVLLVAEARAEEEFVEAVLVATFKALRVVGSGGAFHPEVVQYGVRTAHPRLWYAYGIRARGAQGASSALRLCYVQHTRDW